MPNIKDSVYFVEVMLLFQRGGWLIGMKGWGSCTIRMMVVCFLCQMQVRVGENPQALLGNGLHSVFTCIHSKEDCILQYT